jgi:hypothetical protein
LVAVFGSMVASGFAEIVSLAAVVPFLSVLADPERLWSWPAVRRLAESCGLTAPGQLLLSDGRVEVALLNLAPESWQSAGFPCSRCSAGVLMDGDGLLERGLLTEWLSVVAGPVGGRGGWLPWVEGAFTRAYHGGAVGIASPADDL